MPTQFHSFGIYGLLSRAYIRMYVHIRAICSSAYLNICTCAMYIYFTNYMSCYWHISNSLNMATILQNKSHCPHSILSFKLYDIDIAQLGINGKFPSALYKNPSTTSILSVDKCIFKFVVLSIVDSSQTVSEYLPVGQVSVTANMSIFCSFRRLLIKRSLFFMDCVLTRVSFNLLW